MNRILLLVTDSERARDRAEASLASWCSSAGVEVRAIEAALVISQGCAFDAASVVWLVIDNPNPSKIHELIGHAQDRSLPTMLTRKDESRPAGTLHEDGVVVCPAQTDHGVIRAMLGSLFSQAPVLKNTVSEMRLLSVQQTGLCDQIGKIDEELRLASQLQREFLPAELPSVGDVAFHVLWRPAGYVSGDIYDVQRLDETHVGFFVADAVGHGVPAALMTMYIKRSMRTKEVALDNECGYRLIEPSQVLYRLNKDMVERQGGKIRFATACYGLIDCKNRRLRFARAGHPYPMLLRRDGSTESIEPEGGLLGVFPEEEFEQVSIDLEAGDRLLLYSDGFEVAFPSESRDSSQQRHVATMRYAEEFLDLRHGPVEDALARLDEKLNVQAGSLNQRDDLTVVCLAISAKAMSHQTRSVEPVAVAG